VNKAIAAAVLMLPAILTCAAGTKAQRPEIRASATAAVPRVVPVIRFDAAVDPLTVATTQGLLQSALEAGAEAVVIEWNSPGGQVDAGFALAKTIEAMPIPVICVVDAEAASMAYYILQSCHQRLMTKRSALLIHQPSLAGSFSGNDKDWANIAERLRVLGRAMIEHCSARTKVSADFMASKVADGKDWWLDWREALHIGAVDGVVRSTAAVVASLQKDLQLPDDVIRE